MNIIINQVESTPTLSRKDNVAPSNETICEILSIYFNQTKLSPACSDTSSILFQTCSAYCSKEYPSESSSLSESPSPSTTPSNSPPITVSKSETPSTTVSPSYSSTISVSPIKSDSSLASTLIEYIALFVVGGLVIIACSVFFCYRYQHTNASSKASTQAKYAARVNGLKGSQAQEPDKDHVSFLQNSNNNAVTGTETEQANTISSTNFNPKKENLGSKPRSKQNEHGAGHARTNIKPLPGSLPVPLQKQQQQPQQQQGFGPDEGWAAFPQTNNNNKNSSSGFDTNWSNFPPTITTTANTNATKTYPTTSPSFNSIPTPQSSSTSLNRPSPSPSPLSSPSSSSSPPVVEMKQIAFQPSGFDDDFFSNGFETSKLQPVVVTPIYLQPNQKSLLAHFKSVRELTKQKLINGILYQDNHIQVDCKSKFHFHQAKLALSFENVTDFIISDFSSNFQPFKQISFNHRVPPNKEIKPRSQTQHLIELKCVEAFEDPPTFLMTFTTQNEGSYQISLALPFSVFSFVEPHPFSPEEFDGQVVILQKRGKSTETLPLPNDRSQLVSKIKRVIEDLRLSDVKVILNNNEETQNDRILAKCSGMMRTSTAALGLLGVIHLETLSANENQSLLIDFYSVDNTLAHVAAKTFSQELDESFAI